MCRIRRRGRSEGWWINCPVCWRRRKWHGSPGCPIFLLVYDGEPREDNAEHVPSYTVKKYAVVRYQAKVTYFWGWWPEWRAPVGWIAAWGAIFLVVDTRCRLGEVLSNDGRKRRSGLRAQEDTEEKRRSEGRNKEENNVLGLVLDYPGSTGVVPWEVQSRPARFEDRHAGWPDTCFPSSNSRVRLITATYSSTSFYSPSLTVAFRIHLHTFYRQSSLSTRRSPGFLYHRVSRVWNQEGKGTLCFLQAPRGYLTMQKSTLIPKYKLTRSIVDITYRIFTLSVTPILNHRY